MITCPECGARNGLNALLCTSCGRELPPPTREEPVVEATANDTSTIAMVPVLPPEALLAEAADALAEGKAEAACNLCRQALETEPDNPSGLALLGMAEEERGDLGAALLAYERALELEPDRPIEAHRISELRRRLEEEIVLEEVADDRTRRRNEFLERYTPVFVASAVALFVIVVGSVLIMRVRHGNQLRATEAPYVQAMNYGKEWVGMGEYGNAMLCFQSALQIRPGDSDASRWLAQAQNVQAQLAGYDQLNRDTAGGKWLGPQGGANPFSPTPIGTGVPPVAGALMPAAPEPPFFPDPVLGSGRRGRQETTRNNTRWAQNNTGSEFLQGDVQPSSTTPGGPTTPAGTGTGGNAGGTVTPPEPSRPRGTIVIEAVDVPQRAPRSAAAAEDPSQYRQQARDLAKQGDRQGAASAYRKAIQATQNSAQNPALKKASIDSMQKALDVLEGSGR
jgi:tetratricopeptide (TPR) repeat protein